MARLPGMATPERSGPAPASVALDDKWANLRDGAFVVIDKVTDSVECRECRLRAATAQLVERAVTPS